MSHPESKKTNSRREVQHRSCRERVRDFSEVSQGFDHESALAESQRCLQCKTKPCSRGCPVGIDIPSFIAFIRAGQTQQALCQIKEKNFLPAVCGRVCPQEDQCEAMCVLNKDRAPINIGALERYAADFGETDSSPATTTMNHNTCQKIAVVGSGPAGLTCAADLGRMGYAVTIFESLHQPGGVMIYGIPEFRLPKHIVAKEIHYIRSLGVDIKTNALIGATMTLEDLYSDGFKAVFIATGAGLPNFLGIDQEDAPGVYSANEFLTRVNLMRAHEFPVSATPVKVGRKVLVIGGGNVALDSARCARRLGAETVIVYRRTEQQMPARLEEIANAKDEGIRFEFLSAPTRILTHSSGLVSGLSCIRMSLSEPDASGRPRPVPIPGSEHILETDTIIVAVGQSPNPLLLKKTKGLALSATGTIIIDDNGLTSIPGVFAGGDITTGADTVISAMGAGKRVADAIDAFLKSGLSFRYGECHV